MSSSTREPALSALPPLGRVVREEGRDEAHAWPARAANNKQRMDGWTDGWIFAFVFLSLKATDPLGPRHRLFAPREQSLGSTSRFPKFVEKMHSPANGVGHKWVGWAAFALLVRPQRF